MGGTECAADPPCLAVGDVHRDFKAETHFGVGRRGPFHVSSPKNLRERVETDTVTVGYPPTLEASCMPRDFMPPSITDFNAVSCRIGVGDGHRLRVICAGNPAGMPVLVMHGGPGSGLRINPALFDFACQRVIWVDQRGCGRSTPRGSLRRNRTEQLLRDFETVRKQLGIRRWVVYGGSWGAPLALAYAACFPTCVAALLLRGMHLTTRSETRRFFIGSRPCAAVPWHVLNCAAGGGRLNSVFQRCNDVLLNGTVMEQYAVARAWNAYEARLLRHRQRNQQRSDVREVRAMVDKYRIQAHYLTHNCWLGTSRLHQFATLLRAAACPVVAIHGRRDPVCPTRNVATLQGWLPGLQLQMVDAGHLDNEPSMLRALRAALARLCALPDGSAVMLGAAPSTLSPRT